MSILDWFAKKEKKVQQRKKLDIPGELWVKCYACSDTLYLKDLEENLKVCPCKKQYHFRITAKERIAFLLDKDSFKETETDLEPQDYLTFTDTAPYKDKLKATQKRLKVNDAVMIGTAELNKRPINVGIMDFSFMGGSMGAVVGEKITRLIERAIENKNPLIIFSSSGGARMQEGIISLMQMAKTSAALQKLSEEHVPYLSVLCDPTTGGTSASFSMLGDINIAEPGALISFAGPRVIEQTIRQKLPKGFQRSEFLLEHGMVDMVVNRVDLKAKINDILQILCLPQDQKDLDT